MAPKVKRPRKSRDSKDQTKVLRSDTLEELSSVKSLVLPKTIVEKMVRTAEVQEIKLKDKSGSIIDISTLNDKECIVKITGDNDTQTDETRQFVEDVNNNHLDKPNLEPATDPVSSALSSPSLIKKKISPCRQFRTEHSSFTGHRYNSSMKKKIKPDLAFLDQIYEDEDDHGHDKLEDTISGVKILFSTTAVLV